MTIVLLTVNNAQIRYNDLYNEACMCKILHYVYTTKVQTPHHQSVKHRLLAMYQHYVLQNIIVIQYENHNNALKYEFPLPILKHT